MFLANKLFFASSPEILDQDYKIEHRSEHVQNFVAIGWWSSEISRGKKRK